jgi:hypothetical protein
MARFRCFFISEGDRVERFEPFESASETDAVNRAYEMLRSSPHTAAVEIWESGHFVARIPRDFAKDRT